MLAALTTGRNMSEQRLQQKYAANSQSSHNWHYSSDGRYADIYWHTPVMDALTTGSHWECTSISSPHCTTPIIALVPCLLVLEFVFIYWYLFMVFTPTMVVLTTGMSISSPDYTNPIIALAHCFCFYWYLFIGICSYAHTTKWLPSNN